MSVTLKDVEAMADLTLEAATFLVESIRKGGDPLMTAYAAALAKQHFICKQSADMLLEAGIGAVMHEIFHRGNNDDDDDVMSCIPAIIDVATTAIQHEGIFQTIEGACQLLSQLDRFVKSPNQPVKVAAMSAVADLSLCCQFETEILSNRHYQSAILQILQHASSGARTELQAHALHCIAATFTRINEHAAQTAFELLNAEPVNGEKFLCRLVRLLTGSIEEINTAAHAVLTALCHHCWGRVLLDKYASFFEVVTDRRDAQSYEVSRLRHKIAALYSASDDDNVDPVHHARYTTIAQEGAFVTETEPHVLVDTER